LAKFDDAPDWHDVLEEEEEGDEDEQQWQQYVAEDNELQHQAEEEMKEGIFKMEEQQKMLLW
jgi:hypothetical protein